MDDLHRFYISSVRDRLRLAGAGVPDELRLSCQEHHGVAPVCQSRLLAAMLEIHPVSSRIIWARFKGSPDFFVLCVYAPQSGVCAPEKEFFYAQLSAVCKSFGSFLPVFILGDFNARLHCRLEHEKPHFGSWIFGGGHASLQEQVEGVALNRACFADFCIKLDMWAANTAFQKPELELITHRGAGVLEIIPDMLSQ